MNKDECDFKNIPPDVVGKEWLYSQILNKELNLSFVPPSKNTCDACDEFVINLRQCNTSDEREFLQAHYSAYLLEADKRYNLKKEDKDMTPNNTGQKVLMIDSEKCLPCPKVTNSQRLLQSQVVVFQLHDLLFN
ncbi:hypothetical protein WA026_020264 [Henosepilachna vigintioctopunctata]|uniref:Uncharacterized protein n=1 Tax=Henosepilachna vigintioctopunctata TaxID=420089 RepID=A0AAW1TYW2_9CUCU